MSRKKLINLTLLIVKEELETYKLTNCSLEKQKILDNPELVQELLAYVLSHVPNIYAAVPEEKITEKYQNTGKSLEQRMRIERLIDRVIESLLEKKMAGKYSQIIICQN